MRILEPATTFAFDPPAPAAQADLPARRNRFSVERTAGTMPVWQPRGVEPAAFAPGGLNTVEPAAGPSARPGFRDIVDIINPLQHIPVVGTLYRRATGDTISPAAQFLGGAIFGGPIGAAAALADAAVRDHTGRSIGENVLAMVGAAPAPGADRPAGPAPEITLAATRRKGAEPRMAGTQPVWGAPLAGQTHFATLLTRLSDTNPHIS